MAKVLIVEDDKGINELIKRTLTMTGHDSFQAFTGREAVCIANREPLDLILLDINLPDGSGFKLKKQLKEVPVIFVTARDEIADRVKGLNDGAEDYIVKPFDIEELVARVQAVLRRNHKQQDVYLVGKAKIDLEQHTAFLDSEPVELTNREFELLKVLIINRNIALSRSKLLDLAWGRDFYGDESTVTVHVRRIRQKLGLENYIKTVYKFGYRMEF